MYIQASYRNISFSRFSVCVSENRWHPTIDCLLYMRNPYWYAVKKALSERGWNRFQSCWSWLYIGYWTSIKIYLWVHCKWWPIAYMCANVSLCLFSFTVLPRIKLFSPQHCMPRKTSLKFIHYCTLLSMACKFECVAN